MSRKSSSSSGKAKSGKAVKSKKHTASGSAGKRKATRKATPTPTISEVIETSRRTLTNRRMVVEETPAPAGIDIEVTETAETSEPEVAAPIRELSNRFPSEAVSESSTSSGEVPPSEAFQDLCSRVNEVLVNPGKTNRAISQSDIRAVLYDRTQLLKRGTHTVGFEDCGRAGANTQFKIVISDGNETARLPYGDRYVRLFHLPAGKKK